MTFLAPSPYLLPALGLEDVRHLLACDEARKPLPAQQLGLKRAKSFGSSGLQAEHKPHGFRCCLREHKPYRIGRLEHSTQPAHRP